MRLLPFLDVSPSLCLVSICMLCSKTYTGVSKDSDPMVEALPVAVAIAVAIKWLRTSYPVLHSCWRAAAAAAAALACLAATAF